jgi:predicted amidohydrolase YtcJ
VVASAPVGADLVLVGDVYRVDAARSWARAVAIEGSRIVAVGTEDEVRDRVGPAHELVRGACILPGFQDAHVHAPFAGRIILNVDLADLRTKDAYLDRIGSFARAHPDLSWIVGGGWYNPVFEATGGPLAADLDAVVPDRPAFLMNTDTHAAWVNTKALEAGGVTAGTPDPWDGYYVRDPDGSPAGCLQEGAAYSFSADVVRRDSVDDWRAALRVAQRELHALGITGWQDAWVEPDVLRAYRRLDDSGQLTTRVVTSLWWDRHRGIEQIDGLVEQRSWGSGGNVHASTVKIMLDGCPEASAASMLDPYEGRFGDEHGRGIQFVEDDALADAVTRLDALGFQVHQHALGDRAVRSAIDALRTARDANGANDLRHHIAHLQLPDPADVPRLRDVGAVANMQPFWAQPDEMVESMTRPRVGARAERLYPIGDLSRSGAVLCFGSDWPVSTPDPFAQIEVAVTRRAVGDPDGPALVAAQRIDLATAIAAFTRGSAFVDHDDDAGSIEPGMRADLVVLDRNPFAGPLHQIATTRVAMTVAAGRVVHDAATIAPA